MMNKMQLIMKNEERLNIKILCDNALYFPLNQSAAKLFTSTRN